MGWVFVRRPAIPGEEDKHGARDVSYPANPRYRSAVRAGRLRRDIRRDRRGAAIIERGHGDRESGGRRQDQDRHGGREVADGTGGHERQDAVLLRARLVVEDRLHRRLRLELAAAAAPLRRAGERHRAFGQAHGAGWAKRATGALQRAPAVWVLEG